MLDRSRLHSLFRKNSVQNIRGCFQLLPFSLTSQFLLRFIHPTERKFIFHTDLKECTPFRFVYASMDRKVSKIYQSFCPTETDNASLYKPIPILGSFDITKLGLHNGIQIRCLIDRSREDVVISQWCHLLFFASKLFLNDKKIRFRSRNQNILRSRSERTKLERHRAP